MCFPARSEESIKKQRLGQEKRNVKNNKEERDVKKKKKK